MHGVGVDASANTSDLEFKLRILDYVKHSGIKNTCKDLNVPSKLVDQWVEQERVLRSEWKTISSNSAIVHRSWSRPYGNRMSDENSRRETVRRIVVEEKEINASQKPKSGYGYGYLLWGNKQKAE